jgi:hypothetical protein
MVKELQYNISNNCSPYKEYPNGLSQTKNPDLPATSLEQYAK